MFPTTQAIKAFIDEFEACSLPKSRWTHHAHLVVGLWYLSRHTRDDALTIVRSRIRAYNEAVGTANTDTSGYHETVTRAYVRLLSAFLRTHDGLGVADCVQGLLVSPLAEKAALLRYYTKETLTSVSARKAWVEPDVEPLP